MLARETTGVATTALLTAEELAQLPAVESARHELVRGELVTMAPPGFGHGQDALAIGSRLRAHVRQHSGGHVVVEAGFVLERDPDTVRAPDVAFVRHDRVPEGGVSGFFDGPPDLAVEVVSPSDTAAEVVEKVREYLDAGTRLVWVVERRTRTITVYRPDGTAQLLTAGDTLQGEDVVGGFSVRVEEIFEG